MCLTWYLQKEIYNYHTEILKMAPIYFPSLNYYIYIYHKLNCRIQDVSHLTVESNLRVCALEASSFSMLLQLYTVNSGF